MSCQLYKEVQMLNILFIGDVNGKPGRAAVKALLPGIRKDKQIDFVIANGENAAGGFGITAKTFDELISMGIDVITTGNHIWDKKEVYTLIPAQPRLLRPANMAEENPGRGYNVYECEKNGKTHRIGVINLTGRVYLPPSDDPFKKAVKIANEIRVSTKVIIVDFHAEATSEKVALGHYLDGKVSAVFGTHTHVQTADEKILKEGTAYITDAGMTGPHDSVIGVKKEQIIRRFLTFLPDRFELAEGDNRLNGVVVSVDEETGKSTSIERLNISHA